MVTDFLRGEIEGIQDDINDIKKGLKQVIVVILTALILPIISGIILAAILGLKGNK